MAFGAGKSPVEVLSFTASTIESGSTKLLENLGGNNCLSVASLGSASGVTWVWSTAQVLTNYTLVSFSVKCGS